MPTLPSGIKLALLIDHIMEPDINWFKAPAGNFWYWTPAPENSPPFEPDKVWEGMPISAPIPTSRKEMAEYIRVGIGLENGLMYWRGDTLATFPSYANLSDEDLSAWQEWIATDKVQNYIDSAIIKCQTQAAINQDASGVAVIQAIEEDKSGQIQGYKIIDNPLKGSH
ncbi:MAG: hypothetical protein COZ86_04695 [Candidatus Moranbacteria bacterium CG_4_8_14_3_um_filter_41_13]|nr:MAG: hypothetical protein COZ86_04695 [Candidatus Moranbacteria bacterium CG_4_8_14_3_um_filter_41_13]